MDEAWVAFAAGAVTGVLVTTTWTLAVRRAPAMLGLNAVATIIAALSALATLLVTLARR